MKILIKINRNCYLHIVRQLKVCVTVYCYLDLVVLGKLTAKYSSIVICKENHGTVVPPKREKKSKVTNAMHQINTHSLYQIQLRFWERNSIDGR